HSDIRISKTILSQLSDAYKKIRNTARYILGNLGNGSGFDPDKDCVSDDKLTELDKWAMMKLDSLIDTVKDGYEKYDFHIAFHAVHNFCVVDMSNFYLDIIKDRLYCEKEDSEIRRAAQTVMYRILSALTRLAAPIISFTAEEIWQFMPHSSEDDKESVFLNQMPEKSGLVYDDAFVEKWSFIYGVREAANKALEEARNAKVIGKSLEAKIVIKADADYDRYVSLAEQLKEILIVSDVTVEKSEGETSFAVEAAEGGKCERCWCYSKYVGTNCNHPSLCERCAVAIDV
ncbi:MAG: class I tRNA ligase family protein, partial [Oscillospiraceae bacterium]|nr:class I tRNA ligase family protein [Oscillospiraceae bacterium]